MVFLLAQQSFALGLGEMRVQSYLGEPLRAQVDLTDLGGEFESSLKVRLASPEEYRKAGWAYPYDKKYSFEVVNEDGRHPRLKVRSLRAIEDPFLNLMVEVISPTGLIFKSFTVLIDPSPDYYRKQVSEQSEAQTTTVKTVEPETPATLTKQTAESAIQVPASPAIEVVTVRKNKKRKPHTTSNLNRQASSKPSSRYVAPVANGEQVSDKLSLSLSTSLSISTSDPTLPLSPKEANDALQEDLIAKEKTLKDLNEQIAEMQTLIKGLQIKLSMTAGSGVPESGVLDQSAVAVISQVEVVSAVTEVPVAHIETALAVPQPTMMEEFLAWFSIYSKKIWAGLAVIAMGTGGYYWWRKRKLEKGWIPGGLFDDLANITPTVETPKPFDPIVAEPVAKPAPAPAAPNKVAVQKLTVGEQSMKVPAFKDQKAPSTLPPEYDLLEEANIYLRFGHDKLAEEVLHDALKINPKNPDVYMTLLGIFDTRTDAHGFEKLAKEFKVIADEPTWSKVAEMGRKLDIGNSLYDK
ncbi:MAG: hypothetical protein PHI29_09335 [Gallionella sp.]|nr:hypothetical protein [Gallionella sp.]